MQKGIVSSLLGSFKFQAKFSCFPIRGGCPTSLRLATSVYNLGKAATDAPAGTGILVLPLGIASLALGPGGIGLGAYTVHHVHQLGQTDAPRTTSVVEQNCKDTRKLLTKAMDSIECQQFRRKKGYGGEGKVLTPSEVEAVRDVTSRLLTQHSLCFHVLSGGGMPHWVDCEDLRTLASDVNSKCMGALRKMPEGDHRRLPLVLLHLFAVRASVDARDMVLTHSSPGRSDRSVDSFRGKVLREAMSRLTSEAHTLIELSNNTPYTMAITLAPALFHYSLLLKALALALEGNPPQPPLAMLTDGELVIGQGTEMMLWEDGMDSVRALPVVMRDPGKGSAGETDVVDIVTAADVQWYLEWRELGVDTPLGSIPQEVSASLLLSSLGFPPHLCVTSGEGSQQSAHSDVMKSMVLRSFRQSAEERLRELLGGLGLDATLRAANVSELWESGDGREEDDGASTTSDDSSKLEGEGGGESSERSEHDDDKTGKVLLHREYELAGTLETGGSAFAVAPDGSTLYAAHSDGSIVAWKDGERVETLNGHNDVVRGLAFTSDGALYSGGEDCSVRKWENGRCVGTVSTGSKVSALVTDGKSAVVYAGLHSGEIEKWVEEKRVSVLKGHTTHVQALVMGQDGCYLFSGSGDKSVRQWDVKGGTCVRTMSESFGVSALAFDSDGTLLVGGDGGCILSRWREGERVPSNQSMPITITDWLKRKSTRWVTSLACSSDGSVFVGEDDGLIREWRNGHCVTSFQGCTDHLYSLAVGEGGTLFVGTYHSTRAWKVCREWRTLET